MVVKELVEAVNVCGKRVLVQHVAGVLGVLSVEIGMAVWEQAEVGDKVRLDWREDQQWSNVQAGNGFQATNGTYGILYANCTLLYCAYAL